jgi:hypothetical protein
MFFKSIPTSFVTPSPNLKLEAATYVHIERVRFITQKPMELGHLKGVFFLNVVHRSREFSHLVQSVELALGVAVRGRADMARTC